MSSESEYKLKVLRAFVLEKIKRLVSPLSRFCLKVSLSLLSQLEGPGKVLKNPPNDQSDHQAENRMEWRNSDHLRRNVKELNGR